uniref:TAFH domain-containing protein n=1 Tax=Petromyzon marinus TaxID=7757 RepID=S4RDR8_PETMA
PPAVLPPSPGHPPSLVPNARPFPTTRRWPRQPLSAAPAFFTSGLRVLCDGAVAAPSPPSPCHRCVSAGMVLVQKEGHLILLPHSALQQLRPATPGAAPQFRLPPIHQQPPGTHVIARSVAPTIIKQISPGQTVASTQPTPLQAKVIQPPTVISAPPAAATFSTATLTRPPTPTTPPLRSLTAPSSAAQELMENVKKCKNFLSTLVKLASTGQQSPETAHNVKDLVQSLLDGKIEPEEFTSRLQKELKSSPQPYLVPFLKKSLPALRQMNKNLQTFPAATSSSSAPVPSISLSTIRPTLATGTGLLGIEFLYLTQPARVVVGDKVDITFLVCKNKHGEETVCSPSQDSGRTYKLRSITQSHSRSHLLTVRHNWLFPTLQPIRLTKFLIKILMALAYVDHTASTAQKGKFKDAGGGTFKDDDDINDVASMAGVNINEESAHIAATGSDTVGTQIRSCRDEAFLSGTPLLARMQDIG